MLNFNLTTNFIIKTNNPAGGIEDMNEMYRRSPVSNYFWADKRPDMTEIDIPVSITGNGFTSIHTMSAVRGWLEVPHETQ